MKTNKKGLSKILTGFRASQVLFSCYSKRKLNNHYEQTKYTK